MKKYNFFLRVAQIVIWIGLIACASSLHGYETGCGNDGDNDEDCCDCSDSSGGSSPNESQGKSCGEGNNPVQAHKANLHREVLDITTFGPAPIPFRRSLNSRTSDFNDPYWELGYRQTWQHNWNYEVRQLSTKTFNFFDIKVRYADGNDHNFKALDSTGAQLAPPAHNGDRLYRWSGPTVGYTLVLASGQELDFKRTLSPKFQLIQVRDGLGLSWTCSYDANGRLFRVTNNFGRWIQIDRETGGDGVLRINRVSTSDGRAITYQYSPWAGTGKYVLTSVTYPNGERASYDYATANPTDTAARPLLGGATDPAYKSHAGGAQMKYVYNYDAVSFGAPITGTVLEERSRVTDQKIVSFPLGSGNYPQIVEGDGTEITRQYSSGLMNLAADGEGRTTTFARDAGGAGYITSRTEHNGAVTSYTRDYAGRVLTQTDPLGKTRSRTYNDKGFILTRTDELGRTTATTRDTVNSRPIRVDYPDGTYEAWTYNPNSQPLTHRLRNGGTESFVYNFLGDMTSYTNALGQTTTYTYYPTGLKSSVTDARSNTTGYTYDWRGNILTITHPDNSTVTYGYDVFGNRTSVTDELSHTTLSTYDEYNRLASVTDPLNRTTTFEYGLTPGCSSCSYADVVSRVTSPGGHKTEYQYDKSRLLISQTIGAGTADAATTVFGYDNAKNLTTVTDPHGRIWRLGYDERHKRTSATDPLGNRTEWTYDDRGNKLTEKRPDGGVTQFQYDSRNRLTQATDPLLHVTQMTYDNADNLLTLKDARNNVYTYTYDLLNRKLSLAYPDGAAEAYSYDPAGNLETYTTRAGQVQTFAFDNRNRESGFAWDDGMTPAVAKTYDAAGRLLTLNNDVSDLSYTYDEANQLLSETQNVHGSASPVTVSYSYTPDGLRQSMTYPDGTLASFTYTGRDQAQSVTAGGSVVANYSYDPNGNRLGKTMGNGTSASYAYDDANHLLSVTHSNAGVPFAWFQYGYNAVGNRKYVRRENSRGDTYSYDATDQLTVVQYEAANPDGVPSSPSRIVDYAYDAVGNRTSVTDNGASTGYTSNNLNQYTAIGSSTPAHDANGNFAQDGPAVYYYDAQNRLVRADGGTGTSVGFAYDGRNRRVRQTVTAFQGESSNTTYFSYDKWNLIEERDSSGVQQARYLHGATTDEVLTRVTPSGSTFYHHDALGSTIALTGGTGAVTERYSYDVYGVPTFKDASNTIVGSSASGNRFLFTGREYIAVQNLRLYDYRNRFYLPKTGRFLQTDRLRFKAGDINLYRYVLNNPIRFADPQGDYAGSLLEFGAQVGAGALVGFAVGNAPGAVIGAIAAALIFTPTTAQAPGPPETFGPDPDDWKNPADSDDDETKPEGYVDAWEDCSEQYHDYYNECKNLNNGEDPGLTDEDFQEFMDACMEGKGFSNQGAP